MLSLSGVCVCICLEISLSALDRSICNRIRFVWFASIKITNCFSVNNILPFTDCRLHWPHKVLQFSEPFVVWVWRYSAFDFQCNLPFFSCDENIQKPFNDFHLIFYLFIPNSTSSYSLHSYLFVYVILSIFCVCVCLFDELARHVLVYAKQSFFQQQRPQYQTSMRYNTTNVNAYNCLNARFFSRFIVIVVAAVVVVVVDVVAVVRR